MLGLKHKNKASGKLKMSRIFITDYGDSPIQPYKYAKGCYSLLHKNFIKRAGSTIEWEEAGGGKRMKPIKLNFPLKSWKILRQFVEDKSKLITEKRVKLEKLNL